MPDRRTFLAALAALGAATAASPALAVRAPQSPLPGVVYSHFYPGRWAGMEAIHVPLVRLDGLTLTVETDHPMDADHYIVRHTVVALDGTVVAARTLAPGDAPMTTCELPARGRYRVTSFCNLHDLWITELLA